MNTKVDTDVIRGRR